MYIITHQHIRMRLSIRSGCYLIKSAARRRMYDYYKRTRVKNYFVIVCTHGRI
jgi:ribosomal protein S15P/S13E